MLKRLVSRIICLVMVVNCFTFLAGTVYAEDGIAATISYSSMKQLISSVESKLASLTKEQRSELYNNGKVWFDDNNDIDNLISIVINPEAEIPGKTDSLVNFINQFSGNKNEIIFVLYFIKSIDTNKRITALDNFTLRKEYTSLTSSQEAALESIYETLVGDGFIGTLESDHRINDKVLLNLFSCIKGSFVLTDDKDKPSKLELKSINSAFADRLSDNMSIYFSKINGTSVGYGESIIEVVLDSVNSAETSSVIEDYKDVFEALDMYVERKETSTSGGGTSNPYNTTTPIVSPVIIPQVKPDVIPPPPSNEEILKIVNEFTDLNTKHWGSLYIATLVKAKVLRGYGTGELKPDQGITRQEVAVTLVRALGLEARLEGVQDITFSDSSDIGEWSKKAISLLVEMKILTGYEDGSFKPGNVISRDELAAVIARAVTKPAKNVQMNFNDNNSIPNWAKGYIQKAFSLGIVKGYEDNTFKPNISVTRAEVANMVYNFMYTENLLPGTK